VLELLAGPLALALHATALSAALQESRVSIVAAREKERSRLRRDLHDGLGPVLTGMAFKADAARNILPRRTGAGQRATRPAVRGHHGSDRLHPPPGLRSSPAGTG
jgi:two-component system, NarL family, sensor kinase